MRPLILAAILLLTSTPAWAGHASFAWDAPTTNADGTPLTDLAEYRLYTCPSLPCSKATGTVLATIPAPTARTPVPHDTTGQAFVTAVDTSGNESAESNVIPFDGALASVPPGNLRIE